MIRIPLPFGRAGARADARLAAAGFVCAAGQALLLRELAVPFDGNEVAACAMLSAWMVLTGTGAIAGALRGRGPFVVRKWLPALQGMALIASVLLARCARSFIAGPDETAPDFASMAAAAAVVMAPFCLVSGAMFTAMIRSAGRGYSGARAYAIEAAGFLAGGVTAAVALVLSGDDFSSALLVAFVAFAVAALSETKPSRKAAFALAGGALLAVVVTGAGERAGRATRAWSFPGETVLDSADTKWGNFAVTARGEGRNAAISFRRNGRWVGDPEQERYFEEFVHLALSSVENPSMVLLIGDSLAGGLHCALRHGGRVDCVMEDEPAARLQLKHLSRRDWAAASDPRARIEYGDGRRFAARARSVYDAVVVFESDPVTGASNRFYTAEFFAMARSALRPGGVLAANLDSAPGFQGQRRMALAASVLAAMRRSFGSVRPVWTDSAGMVLLASDGPLHASADELADRMEGRAAVSPAVNRAWFRNALAREAPDYGEAEPNSDLRPASYLHAFALREAMFGPVAFAVPVGLIAAPIALFLVAAAMRAGRRRRFPGAPLASFAGGLSGMALSAGFLLAYQASAGAIYAHLGALSGAFMAGAAAGALAGRVVPRPAAGVVATGAGFAALGAASFFALGPVCAVGTGSWSLPAFMGFQAAAGLLTGALFPLLARAHSADGASGTTSIWSSDLAGSAIGAMLAGAVAIPLIGIPWTAMLAGLFALAGSFAGLTGIGPGDGAFMRGKE